MSLTLIEQMELTRLEHYECEVWVEELWSANSLYKYIVRNKHAMPVLHPRAAKLQKNIIEQTPPLKLPPELIQAYTAKLTFIASHSAWCTDTDKLRKLDVSNLIKITEDAFCRALRLDDSLCTTLLATKQMTTRRYLGGSLINLQLTTYGKNIGDVPGASTIMKLEQFIQRSRAHNSS